MPSIDTRLEIQLSLKISMLGKPSWYLGSRNAGSFAPRLPSVPGDVSAHPQITISRAFQFPLHAAKDV